MLFEQNPKRPGAGNSSSAPTGKGPRVGNRPHTDTGNNEDFPQRHTSGHGQVEFTSENWPTRENAVQAGETYSGDGGQFPFKTAEENASNYTQRGRVPRQEVQDAVSREGRVKKNEREQRQSNPRGQR